MSDCDDFFYTFHGNLDWVQVKVRFQIHTKITIFEGVLLIFVLTNTNLAEIFLCVAQHFFVLPIIDMESPKSDVNGWKKILCFELLGIRKWQNPKTNVLETYRPYLYWTRLEFPYKKKMPRSGYFRSGFEVHFFKTHFFLDWLIVQYTLHSLYTTKNREPFFYYTCIRFL